MWYEIADENDLNSFMKMFGGFHDSCIKEMKYLSGAYVKSDLSMFPCNKDRLLKVIIQRQYPNPCAIEMEFMGLLNMNLFLEDADGYTCEIPAATMILAEDRIYWCDCIVSSEADLESYKGTLICSKSVRWRECDEYIGDEDVYIAREAPS